jgi:small subunit ribosomal protein S1
VRGRVTKLVPFGAFVELRPGIEGLIHISELSNRHVEQPDEILEVNQEIEVKIIDIDIDRRRISLSLRQAAGKARRAAEVEEPEPEEATALPEEAEEKATDRVQASVDETRLEEEEPESAIGEAPAEVPEHEAVELAAEPEGVEVREEEKEEEAEAASPQEETSAVPKGAGEEGEPGETKEYAEGTLESIIEDMKRGSR